MTKKKCGVDRLVLAFVYPSDTEPGKWIARGNIWNGIPYGKSGHRLEFATCVCDSVDAALQATKLFISPDITIKPGSKITVTQTGVTTEYTGSGVPAVYPTHQEIMLELFESWA